jgi:hypothetical protein
MKRNVQLLLILFNNKHLQAVRDPSVFIALPTLPATQTNMAGKGE